VCVCVCVRERNSERESVCVRAFPPKNGEIALWPSTNGSIARLLVWVTILNVRQSRLYLHYWYRYVSLPKLSRELKNRSDQNIVPLNLIIGLIWFLRKTILGARQRGATRRSSRLPSGQVHIPGVYPPKTNGAPIPGVYRILSLDIVTRSIGLFRLNGGLSDFLPNTGGISYFYSIPGMYWIRHSKSGGLWKKIR